MLTPKRSRLLAFIKEYISEHGYAPSFEEMRHYMGVKSVSGIHTMLTALAKNRYVVKHPRNARGIELMRSNGASVSASVTSTAQGHSLQEERAPNNAARMHAFGAGVITTNRARRTKIIRIPMLGKISAGLPIDAINDVQEHIDIPSSIINDKDQQHYAVRIDGDSMIDAGILPDDIAIISVQHVAASGDIVVALIDQSEVTLKRFFLEGGEVILKAENRNYPLIRLRPDRVLIQGRLCANLRFYS